MKLTRKTAEEIAKMQREERELWMEATTDIAQARHGGRADILKEILTIAEGAFFLSVDALDKCFID